MFGLKIIKEEHYDNLKGSYQTLSNDYRIALSSIKQLTEEISGQTKDCKMGPWCEGCKHRRYVYVQDNIVNFGIYVHIREEKDRRIMEYCGKHIHEICPEWEEHIKEAAQPNV